MRLAHYCGAFFFTFFASQAIGQNKDAKLPDEIIRNSDIASVLSDISPELLKAIAKEAKLQEKKGLSAEDRRFFQDLFRDKEDSLKRQLPATAIKDIIGLDLAPNAETAKVYVTPGYDTHIRFVDAAGKPWPMTYKSGGSQEDFKTSSVISPNGDGIINAIKVEGFFRKGSTNLTVMLKDLNEIIYIDLVADDQRYHPAATIMVPKYGPLTKDIPDHSVKPVVHDSEMKSVLYGGASLSESFVRLQSSDSNVEAWKHAKSGELFVRSNMSLVTPHPLGVHNGTGGYRAYRTPYLPVLIFNNDNGNERIVTLQEIN